MTFRRIRKRFYRILKIHKSVYTHDFASPENSGDLQIRFLPRKKSALRAHLNWLTSKHTSILANRHMMTSQFRSERGKTRKREISRDFSRFFDPEFFSEFHRSLLPFSMLCPDSDSRKGLFCVFPKAIDPVAGFGLAKAEPGSVKKLPLHKLFTTKPQNLIIISLLRAFLARGDSFPS